jgi:phage terminase large subunit-like protein
MMAWTVSNAKARMQGSAVLIEKAVAGKAKIDPLIALFNAAELMGRNPQAGLGASYLENAEMMVL